MDLIVFVVCMCAANGFVCVCVMTSLIMIKKIYKEYKDKCCFWLLFNFIVYPHVVVSMVVRCWWRWWQLFETSKSRRLLCLLFRQKHSSLHTKHFVFICRYAFKLSYTSHLLFLLSIFPSLSFSLFSLSISNLISASCCLKI